ncbi:MAG: TIGR01777 family oxidoreductase [Deltaproteobacteria bacterium]|nr:TIGR01777 family oxidoreductase [Deltaproteobacteria bacterium]
MKVFVTGGSGFVGSTLTGKLTRSGHQVTILTRSIRKENTLPEGASFLEGDPTREGAWQDRVADHDAVINLAGASIFKRWTDGYKETLRESRLLTTRHLVDAIAPRTGKETHLISTSAVGYYGFHEDETLEETDPSGTDFLATLASDWEEAALEARNYGARVVLCRFGIVMGREGGALAQMVPPFHFWMGAPLGSGKQWFSWIHEEDLADVFQFVLEHKDLEGPLNCTAPHPVRNREMTQMIGKALGKPTFLPPAPAFFIRWILGAFGDVILKGQRVYPKRLLDQGFIFRFSTMHEALTDLL